MPETVTLSTQGPHSPEYTQQLAATIAEALQCLNHATRFGVAGLENPSDVYALLGELAAALDRLPQLLNQVAGFLRAQEATGRLRDSRGLDAGTQIAIAVGALITARSHAGGLADNLHAAQDYTAGLYVQEDSGA